MPEAHQASPILIDEEPDEPVEDRLQWLLDQKQKELLKLRMEQQELELQALRKQLFAAQAIRMAASATHSAPHDSKVPLAVPGERRDSLLQGTLQLAAKLHAERLEEKKQQLQRLLAKRRAAADAGACITVEQDEQEKRQEGGSDRADSSC